jgi:(p)ppGpp synthase/HD superfamily hydrolase
VEDAVDAGQASHLKKALELASRVHSGQLRDDGSPYIDHPIRVALILLDEVHIADTDLLCAALLHDAPEDCPSLSFESLEREFGSKVRHIVETLTKPRDEGLTREEINAVYFQRLVRADGNCKLVKLADKLDNVRDSVHSPAIAKRARTVDEAERFYVPLSAQLSTASHTIFERLFKIAIEDAFRAGPDKSSC